MKPFKTHSGTAAILYRGNIDTDQIISKEHLKSIKRTGFGPSLFSDWRYLPDGSLNPNFELNRKEFSGATVLITGNNFGCGSSREHAVWAIQQYGFVAVIAPSLTKNNTTIPGFADIFRNNAIKNGLLLIELPEKNVLELKSAIEKNPQTTISIDLEQQKLILSDLNFSFPYDVSAKERLLHGLDDIGISLKYADNIDAYEKMHVLI